MTRQEKLPSKRPILLGLLLNCNSTLANSTLLSYPEKNQSVLIYRLCFLLLFSAFWCFFVLVTYLHTSILAIGK